MNIRESAVTLPDNVKLSDVQVAEIRKAFAMCDRDGDGFIDATDLRTGMLCVFALWEMALTIDGSAGRHSPRSSS